MRRLILLFTLCGLFAAAFGSAEDDLKKEPGRPPRELKGLRTGNSETFRRHDGSRVTRMYARNHFYTAGESYESLSLTAKAENREGYSYVVDAGPYRYRYDPAHKGKGYRFEHEGYYVSYCPSGDWTGKTYSVVPKADGVKELVEISETSDGSVRWQVSSNAVQVFKDGELRFTTLEGVFLCRIQRPYAWDAQGTIIPVAVTFSGDTLSYTLDIADRKSVSWPVVLDPTTTIEDEDNKTGFMQAYDNSSYTTARSKTESDVPVNATPIWVGQQRDASGYYRVNRSSLVFDTSALPESAVIDSAQVVLVTGYDGTDMDFDMKLVAPTFSGEWVKAWFNDFVGWASSGTYSVTDLSAVVNSSVCCAVGDTCRFTLTAAGLDSINTSGETRFMLMSVEDINNSAPLNNTEERLQFEDDSAYIMVWYTLPAIPSNFTMTALDSVTIHCTWVDNSGGEEAFYIVNYADSTVVDSTAANEESITIDGLAPNTWYTWAVVADSSGAQWFSEPDSACTKTGAPSSARFVHFRSSYFSLTFEGGENPDSTEFALPVVINGDTLYWNDAAGDTTSAVYTKTRAAWGDTVKVGYRGLLQPDTSYSVGIHGKNQDGQWLESWYGVKTSEPPSAIVLDLATGAYALEEFTGISGVNNYGAMRSIANDDSVETDDLTPDLGQTFISPDYGIMRLGLQVSLPEAYEAYAGSLFVCVTVDSTDTDFSIAAFEGNWAAGSYYDDAFWDFDGHESGTTPHTGTNLFEPWDTSELTESADYNLVFNDTGLETVRQALDELLRITIVSSRDSSGTAPSGNEFFTIDGDSSRLKLIVDLPDSLPGNVQMIPAGPDSMIVTWDDRNRSETGYRIVDVADSSAVTDVLAANTEIAGIGGLAVNAAYRYLVEVIGGNLNGLYSVTDSAYTNAAVPGIPALATAGTTSLIFTIDPGGNPSYTKFAIQDSLSGWYVDGSAEPETLRAPPLGEWGWRTYSEWGAALGDTLTGLTPDTHYVIRVKARSGE